MTRFLAPAVVIIVILTGCGDVRAAHQRSPDRCRPFGDSATSAGQNQRWPRPRHGCGSRRGTPRRARLVHLCQPERRPLGKPLCGRRQERRRPTLRRRGLVGARRHRRLHSGNAVRYCRFTVPRKATSLHIPITAGGRPYDLLRRPGPEDPAVDGTTLYIGNLGQTVAVYADSSTTPTGQLTDPSVSMGIGTAIESTITSFGRSSTTRTAPGRSSSFCRVTCRASLCPG